MLKTWCYIKCAKGRDNMNFAHWETEENMKKYIPLVGVNGKSEIESSGLPISYDDYNLYITKTLRHSLVIGSTISGVATGVAGILLTGVNTVSTTVSLDTTS